MRLPFLALILLILSAKAEPTAFKAEDIKFFEKNIRPLLEEKCYRCHSHSVTIKKKLKGNLFLDSRIDIIQGGNGGPAALPGKADQSSIIKSVTHQDTDERMPPKEKEWLTKEEINNLKAWINKGMAWPKEPRPTGAEGFRDLFDVQKRKDQHWSWAQLKQPKPPKNSKQKHAIDKFIEVKLKEQKLTLSAQASKERLIRRAYLDITGLLPNHTDVDLFINDRSPQAFETVLEKLLADKAYGERWARHWLDLVRYAESHGHEFDYSIPGAFQYRDMVIRSQNKDITHDQWLKDHVAGDLLKKPRIDKETGLNDSLIATGQWFFFEATHAPVDVKEDEVLRLNNQIDTFSKSFLGLTVACARCHDHKFDAITAKDFYALSGYLQSSRRQEALMDPSGKINEAKKKIEQLHAASSKRQNNVNPTTIKYLKAAYELFSPMPSAHTSGKSLVFADFENGYQKWKATGTAFGDRPLSEKYRTGHVVTGYSDQHYVCSHHPFALKENADNRTGKLESPTFTINLKNISFLIAGGNHKDKTCVNLEINGEVVLSQSGFNNNDLKEIIWDVSKWKGKQAKIVLVDNQEGGWGHITVDRFLFSDGPVLFYKKPLPSVSQKYGLNPEILKSWVNEFKNAYANNESPLHLIAQASAGNFQVAKESLLKKISTDQKAANEFSDSTELFEDFSSDNYKNVRITGQAFHTNKTPGFIDSGELAKEFQGVVRTKDFIIDGPIHINISGNNTTVRVIIEDYFLDQRNALLFGGLINKINSEKATWITIARDLLRYKGKRAHIEIIDHSKEGSFKVHEIRFGNGTPPRSQAKKDLIALAQTTSTKDLLNKIVTSNAFITLLQKKKDLVKPNESIQERLKEITSKMPTPTVAMALDDGFPLDNYVYLRGAHAKKGVDAPRAFLEALSGPTQTQSETGSGRLELAEKILKDGRQFLSRVQVNRIWLHLFGKGIVPTPDDFGVLGMQPTHPELLDHLALKYIELGWSNKKMIKYIMTSNTYKQSSRITNPTFEKIDPRNLLYHRAQVRRLEGEIIRDIILQTSGQLKKEMFGPSTPNYLTSFMTGRGRPKSGPVDGNGRRSIYLAVRRNFLNPFFLTFDFPIPAQAIGKRNSTNVPAQALSLLNDPFIAAQAEIITGDIEKMLGKKLSHEAIINSLFLKFYSRKANANEKMLLKPQLGNKESIKQLVHILINKKEFSHVF